MFTLPSRIALVIASLALAVPVAAIPLQKAGVLENFHNRTLAKPATAEQFLNDPAAYFSQQKQWLADRVYPIVEAAGALKRYRLSLLGTPPEKRLTLGPDGIIFLNSGSDKYLNSILQLVCIHGHRPETVTQFKASLSLLAEFEASKRVPVDVVVFPSKETLYGDKLPASVPRKYREACGAVAAGQSPMMDLVRETQTPAIVLPRAELMAHIDDEALFPKGNWHPRGLSVQIVRDAYLKRIGVEPPTGERLERTLVQSELMGSYNISWLLPEYRFENSHITLRRDLSTELSNELAGLFDSPRRSVAVFETRDAPSPNRVLMVSDSYGDAAAPIFAGGFSGLVHVTTNDMRNQDLAALIAKVRERYPIDRIIMLIQEGNLDRVLLWASHLPK